MISAEVVMVMGSFDSVEGTTGSITRPLYMRDLQPPTPDRKL
jgi:hypothetical protein